MSDLSVCSTHGGLNPYPVAVLQYCLAASHYPNREPL